MNRSLLIFYSHRSASLIQVCKLGELPLAVLKVQKEVQRVKHK